MAEEFAEVAVNVTTVGAKEGQEEAVAQRSLEGREEGCRVGDDSLHLLPLALEAEGHCRVDGLRVSPGHSDESHHGVGPHGDLVF